MKVKHVEQVATQPMTYAHRMLTVGDTFMATRRDAKILQALRRSKDAPSSPSELESLRMQYEKASSMSADKRWGERRLRQEIEALQK